MLFLSLYLGLWLRFGNSPITHGVTVIFSEDHFFIVFVPGYF